MWVERVPYLRPQRVPDVNHYTILFDRQGAAAVARAITTTAASPAAQHRTGCSAGWMDG